VAVDNPDVVDIVSIEPSGNVVLTVSDHLDWLDSIAHQEILQGKINRYLAFVESGEILDRYPDAQGRKVVIRVAMQFEPDVEGLRFLDRAKSALERAGFQFVWHRLNPVSAT